MPAPRFFHFASIVMLFAWSAVLLYFYASGRVDKLLTENFRYGPLVGGLGLAVVGFFNLFTAKSEAACCHEHHHHDHGHDHDHDHTCCGGHHEHEHEHEHHHHEQDDAAADPHEHLHTHDDQTFLGVLATLAIVLVPAVGAASLAQDKLSLETLKNKGLYSNEVVAPVNPAENAANPAGGEDESDQYTLADLEKQVRKSEDGNFLIPIPSLFYSAADTELADVLAGQPIETTGQVAPEIDANDPDGTRLRLYRLFVSCCLADARPIGFSADFGKAPPQFPDDTWVKIVGKMAYPEREGRRVPILEVDTVEAIPEPEDMMY